MAEGDYPVVVARVTVQLADGREEVWGVAVRPVSGAPHYSWRVFLPESARIVGKELEVLPVSASQEITVDQREVPIDYRQTWLDPTPQR